MKRYVDDGLTLVYRVEHVDDGLGPYQNEALEKIMRPKHNNCRTHPIPFDDFGDFYDWHGKLFGCPSLPILREWFQGFGDHLAELGYVVRVYDCSDTEATGFKLGRNKMQAVFYPDAPVIEVRGVDWD